MKLSEAAATVIPLARAIQDYWNTELPKRHPDYPLINRGEDSGPPPPEEAQLREFLAGLPPEMVYQLMAIMDLSWGRFETANLAEHLEQLKTTLPKPEWAIAILMGKTPLASYLADGLDKLKRDRINVDKLFAKASKTRK